MVWHRQTNGHRYFYHSKIVRGKLVHTYLGTGPAAELVALQDARRREAQSQARRQELANFQSAERPLMYMTKGTDLLFHAALLESGFHQHDRGEWRRRRDSAHPNQSTDC
jgi:hypothetical protein